MSTEFLKLLPAYLWPVRAIKQPETNSDAGWGTVQLFIYPAGTEIPPNKQTDAGTASKTNPDQPVQASAAATGNPK
jgi:hypothetical protein